jgi:hypothetical protein
LRDKLKSEEYFQSYFTSFGEVDEIYGGFVEDLSNPYDRRLNVQYSKFTSRMYLVVAAYSRGQSKAEIRPLIDDCLANLAIFVELAQQDEPAFRKEYSGGFDGWYRILAFCVLWDLPRNLTDIVLDFLVLQMKVPEHASDALVNKIVKYLGYPGQDETDHLLWLQAYGRLFNCFKLHEAYRSDELKLFVDGWYGGMSDTAWHDTHNNKHDIYFGYWCFEAAAVAKMLSIDDRSLEIHPNYPFDARHG